MGEGLYTILPAGPAFLERGEPSWRQELGLNGEVGVLQGELAPECCALIVMIAGDWIGVLQGELGSAAANGKASSQLADEWDRPKIISGAPGSAIPRLFSDLRLAC